MIASVEELARLLCETEDKLPDGQHVNYGPGDGERRPCDKHRKMAARLEGSVTVEAPRAPEPGPEGPVNDAPWLMPVQTNRPNPREPGVIRESVYMAAYEVYCYGHGPQEALITGGCRGGFSSGELVAFLYARAFPKEQWRARTDEAFVGLNV